MNRIFCCWLLKLPLFSLSFCCGAVSTHTHTHFLLGLTRVPTHTPVSGQMASERMTGSALCFARARETPNFALTPETTRARETPFTGDGRLQCTFSLSSSSHFGFRCRRRRCRSFGPIRSSEEDLGKGRNRGKGEGKGRGKLQVTKKKPR